MSTCHRYRIIMRYLWRRNLASNLVGVSIVLILVAVYISLLRYNKASSLNRFNLNPRSLRKVRSNRDQEHDGDTDRSPRRSHGFWSSFISQNGKHFHVHLIEDGHDVLPIWFDAAKNGFIPLQGNTLVLIDGYNNMAPAHFFSQYPARRISKEKQDIQRLTRKNDAFLVEAASAELIKKIIWVWPLWDAKEHIVPEVTTQGEVGIATVEDNKHGKHKVFCLCKQNNTKPTHHRSCIYLPIDSSHSKTIKPGLCRLKKVFQYTEIREDIALQKLNSNTLIAEKESVLLAVDAEYYGSVLTSKALLNSNLSLITIRQIDRIIKKLFCPFNTRQEKAVDQVLVTALGIFKKSPICIKEGQKNQVKHNKTKSGKKIGTKLTTKKPNVDHTSCKTDSRIKEAETLLKKHLWNTAKLSYSCSKKSPQSEKYVKDLVSILQRLTLRQIRSLQFTGFCMSTGPRRIKTNTNSNFRICHGQNLPDNTHVDEHVPQLGDVEKQSKILQQILTKTKIHRPALTTVLRSVRAGLTPRRYFTRIEHDIINSINSTFKNVQIHYNGDLLGGKKGWPSRHRPTG